MQGANIGRYLGLAIAVTAASHGCGSSTTPGGQDLALAYWSGCGSNCCPDWGCGTNGAWLGQGVPFHELDGSGQQANRAGLRIVGFHAQDGTALKVAVDRDVLGGVRPDGSVATGEELVGAQLELVRVAQPDQPPATIAALERQPELYVVTIVGVSTTTYWVDPGDEVIPVYQFEFKKVGAPGKELTRVCADPAEGDSRWDGLHGMALVWSGDRYNERTKRVRQTGAGDPWFNLGCAGTTVAKLHLLRHTWASDRDGLHPTSVAQRQTLLKLLVADYCGSGKPFTVDGHPLTYAYAQPWSLEADWAGAASLDAVWGPERAVCLNVPRLKDQYVHIRDLIVNRCAAEGYTLKPCGTALMTSLKALGPGGTTPWPGYAVSANPGSTSP